MVHSSRLLHCYAAPMACRPLRADVSGQEHTAALKTPMPLTGALAGTRQCCAQPHMGHPSLKRQQPPHLGAGRVGVHLVLERAHDGVLGVDLQCLATLHVLCGAAVAQRLRRGHAGRAPSPQTDTRISQGQRMHSSVCAGGMQAGPLPSGRHTKITGTAACTAASARATTHSAPSPQPAVGGGMTEQPPAAPVMSGEHLSASPQKTQGIPLRGGAPARLLPQC